MHLPWLAQKVSLAVVKVKEARHTATLGLLLTAHAGIGDVAGVSCAAVTHKIVVIVIPA